MKNLLRVVKIEIKSNFTVARIAGPLIIILISLITPLTIGKIDGHGNIGEATKKMLGEIIAQGVIYSLGLRVSLMLKDGSTLDKNRALFLSMNKRQVVFGKVFADVLLFVATVGAIAIIGPLLIVYKNGGVLSSGIISQIVIFIIAMTCFYAFISVGSRFIVSAIRGKIKWAVFSLFMIATVLAYLVLAIVVPGVGKVKHFYIDNKLYFSFVPFTNIGYLSMVLYGTAPLWTAVPLIVESAIFIVAIWWPLSTSVKEYLCG